MGFVEMYGEGGHHYDGCVVERDPAVGALLSTSVDCSHSAQLQRGPLIENSRFEFCGDDIGNV